MSGLRTEFEFVLPKGLVDDDGTVHRQGTMRLATARDELEPLNDPKVKDADDPYLTIIVLARVITGLGSRTRLSPKDVEGLFAADLAYLQDFYSVINFGTEAELDQLQRSVADVSRAARRFTPEPEPVARTPASSPTAVTAEAAAAAIEARAAALEAQRMAADRVETADAGVDLPAARRRKATAPDLPAEEEIADGPVVGEDGIELPTPRRNRIEEVGRSSERPRGAR
jgi:hypothetical protein